MAVTSDDRLGELERPILDTEWSDGPQRRSPLWLEALVIAWLLVIYDAVNNLSALRLKSALAHGRSILRVENLLHFNPELTLNAWANAHRAFALPMADFYDTAHFVITLSLVALLWWRYPKLYRPLRNTLVLINVVGFVVFWLYPLAPPRMLAGAGFIDVVAVTHAIGSWQVGTLASQANELAAMPSLHVAWACWSSLSVWRILAGRRWRAVVVIYPVMTGVIVMATANHYFFDCLGGLLTILVAYGLAKVFSALRNRIKAGGKILAGSS